MQVALREQPQCTADPESPTSLGLSGSYPTIRVLNTATMEWLRLECAPSLVQAALIFARPNQPARNKRGKPAAARRQ